MKICFIAAGGIEWGSSRMRAYWVAEALRERWHTVDVFPYQEVKEYRKETPGFFNYDVYIWQKLAMVNAIPNARHYWDVCDPAWWWQPNECREIAEYMTGVVASSEALAGDFNVWYGGELATCIPDRLDLSHFTKQRQHTAVSPVRLIWFGVAVNRVALFGAAANLERLVANGHKIELTICDDRPGERLPISKSFPIYHTQWSLSSEVETFTNHDIAILPPYPGAWGMVKSNNKTLTAWACGLPVADGIDYASLEHLVRDSETRKWQGIAGRMTVENEYTIDKSAAEWEVILS